MYAKINITYENWSPEDVVAGDTDDRGFEAEGELIEPDDLRKLLEGCEASQHPLPGRAGLPGVWFTDHGDVDYATGRRVVRSYHCAHDATAWQKMLWIWAIVNVEL